MDKTILSLHNISKAYPGVIALSGIDLDFIEGEIHGLVGENGAGKSTMIKVIAGAIEPTSGKFVIDGKDYERISPRTAKDIGIEVIYQEFNLVASLSVAENLFLGDMPGNAAFVDFDTMRAETKKVFDMMEVNIDPDELVENLSTAQMQLAEIAKALRKKVKILVMDEPTAPLTIHETEILYRLIRKLKKDGVTIIYISHRLSEIFELADRITILRDGKKILTEPNSELDSATLIRYMVGREMGDIYPERNVTAGEVVLEAKDLTGPGFRDINFQLRKGEILGFAGLIGAGRTEIMRVLFGAERQISGDILINGEKVILSSPKDGIAHSIGYVPEDRKLQGAILGLPIRDNLSLAILRRISKWFFVDSKKEEEILNKYKDALYIKTPSFDQLVQNLSGGNQQKIVISKWLATDSKILIMDEPTRGIDVGAKQEIYNLMNDLTKQGISILVVMSEMEELIGVADRIIVLHEGFQMGELKDRSEFEQDRILTLASGIQNIA